MFGKQTCIPDLSNWSELSHCCPLKEGPSPPLLSQPPLLPVVFLTLGWLNVTAKFKTKADISEMPESSTQSVSCIYINYLAPVAFEFAIPDHAVIGP